MTFKKQPKLEVVIMDGEYGILIVYEALINRK
jgi:hypothetical protein